MKLPEPVNRLSVENLRKIEPLVRDRRISLGDDQTGSPSVHLTVILDDRVSDEDIAQRRFRKLEDWVQKTVWDGSDYRFWPYLTFRRVTEDKSLAVP